MNDKYNRAQFEQYAESQGLRDFEYDQDDASRYRNPFTQREWNYWVAALECVALAARATPAQPAGDELTPLDYRAQGREEALAVILAEDPENPFEDCIDSERDSTDEYNTFWKEDKLRELLHIGDRKHDAYDRAEGQYWEALGRTDEAKRAQAFAENMNSSGKVRAALAKHGEYDLIAELCTAQPSPSSVGAAIRALPLPESRNSDSFGRLFTSDQVRALLSEAAALAEQVQGQQKSEEFMRGVIASLGALAPHCKYGDVIHDEIVRSVGKDALYCAAEPEDIKWAGLDPLYYAEIKQKEGK